MSVEQLRTNPKPSSLFENPPQSLDWLPRRKGRRSPAKAEQIEVISTSRLDLRRKFLHTLNLEAPDAIEQLRSEALKHARTAGRARSSLAALRDAIGVWAKDWHLCEHPCEQWIADCIVMTVHDYRADPALIGKEWTMPWPVDRRFETLRLDPWYPTEESEADFRKRIEQYIGLVKRKAKTDGLRPEPERRQLPRHLKWLIRHKVLKKSFYKIAANEKINTRAISRAIKEIAAELPVSLPKKNTQ